MTPVRSSFLRGCVASAPFVIVVIPFALLFGVVATEAGLNLLQVMLFSFSVFAGASQFAAVQLMQDQAPVLVVLATSLAVNLRMVMYSVAMAPHLGAAPFGTRALMAYFLVDQSFAASQAEFERRPDQPLADKVAFFFGTVTPIAPMWFVATFAGAVVGEAIPPEYALDFVVPVAFLAMVSPMLRTAAQYAAAAVSVLTSLALVWMPYSTGLLVAAVLAMVTGAAVEAMVARQATKRGNDDRG